MEPKAGPYDLYNFNIHNQCNFNGAPYCWCGLLEKYQAVFELKPRLDYVRYDR